VCDSQYFILGPEVEAFEREAAAALAWPRRGRHSGTDALLAALMALGVDRATRWWCRPSPSSRPPGRRAPRREAGVRDITARDYCVDPDALAAAIGRAPRR